MKKRSKLFRSIILGVATVVGLSTFGAFGTCSAKAAGGNWRYEKLNTSWINRSKPMVAFAFDDGPVSSQGNTPGMRILNTLKKYNQHATFFYWGNKINNSNKDEVGYANYIGCEIGNHTWTHSNLTKLGSWQIQNEIEQCRSKLQQITGLHSFLVRPPYLATNYTVSQNVNVPMITCSLDTGDWNNGNYQSIVNKLRQVRDGDILLMHETYAATAQAVETMVPELLNRGFQIVSVSELAAMKGRNLQKGQVYNSFR